MKERNTLDLQIITANLNAFNLLMKDYLTAKDKADIVAYDMEAARLAEAYRLTYHAEPKYYGTRTHEDLMELKEQLEREVNK